RCRSPVWGSSSRSRSRPRSPTCCAGSPTGSMPRCAAPRRPSSPQTKRTGRRREVRLGHQHGHSSERMRMARGVFASRLKRAAVVLGVLVAVPGLMLLAACGSKPEAGRVLRIVSGSENQALQPIVEQFAADHGFEVKIDYKGSVDIMLMLQRGDLQ